MDVKKLPGDVISITNYINPQLFWYANIKEVKKCSMELKQMEHDIQPYYKGITETRTNGDLVVLNYLPIRKLIRGRVVEVHRSNPNSCTVWAIDYGFPIETNCEYMSSLPEKFDKSFGHIHCGGIGYVKLHDNIPLASKCFGSVLGQAKSLHFNTMFETDDGQSFGHMYIDNELHKYSAAEYLIGKNLAVAAPDFESTCANIASIQYCSWLSVVGKSLAILNASHVSDSKCRIISNLVSIYTKPALPLPPPVIATDVVKPTNIFKYSFELPVSPEQRRENYNSLGIAKHCVTEAKFDNGFATEKSTAKMLMSGKPTYLPIDNGHTRYRQKIASLTDPSLQQDKIAEILEMFDENNSGESPKSYSYSFRKLNRLLHKQTNANRSNKIEKPKDSATDDVPTKKLESNTKQKETKNRFDFVKTSQTDANANKKKQNVEELVFKTPKDDLSFKDATTIDKEICKNNNKSTDKKTYSIESKKKEEQIQGDTLIDKNLMKMESVKKEIPHKTSHTMPPMIDKAINTIDEDTLNVEKIAIPHKTSHTKPSMIDKAINTIDDDSLKVEDIANEINIDSKKEISDKATNTKSTHKGINKIELKNGKINESEQNLNEEKEEFVELHIKAERELIKLSNIPNYIGDTTNGFGQRHIRALKSDFNQKFHRQHMNKTFISFGKISSMDPSSKLKIITAGKSNKPFYGKDKSVSNKTCVTEGSNTKNQITNIPATTNTTEAINNNSPKSSNCSPEQENNIQETNRRGNRRWRRRRNTRNFNRNNGHIVNPSWIECRNAKAANTETNDNSNAKTKMTNNQESKDSPQLDNVENMDKINKLINEMTPRLETKKSNIPENNAHSLQCNFMNDVVLAHSTVPIIPVGNIDHIDFQPNVRRIMNQRGITTVLDIQKFTWPHLLHGNQSLVLISQQKSGRTWGYLPALCSHVEKQSYLELKKYKPNKMNFGPMAIVVVAGNKEAQEVSYACEALLKTDISKARHVVAAYAGENLSNIRISLHNACKILVTTIPKLKQLLKYDITEKFFNPDRLSYLVIDDLDLITTHNDQQFKNLLGDLLQLCKVNKSNKNLKPQLVLTSKHWQPNYMEPYLKLANTPLLIFGDFLEAATFAKTKLRLKMINMHDDKLQYIIDFLEYRTCHGRTVIYCNECSEVLALQKQLENANYECLAFVKTSSSTSSSTSPNIEAKENIKDWLSQPTKKILILSDDCPEIKIVKSAKYLLHYTFAKTWNKFTQRFISVTDSFYNTVATMKDLNGSNKKYTKNVYLSLVLIDHKDDKWMPQISNFMEKHNVEFSQSMVSLVMKTKSKIEEERTVIGVSLCPMLATYGVCSEYNCLSRHELNKLDVVPDDHKDNIPIDGDIIIKVLKIYNPAHYAVVVLRHQQQGSRTWRDLPNKESHVSMSFKLLMYYSIKENNKMHWPPKPQDICVIKSRGEYERVRILTVGQMRNTLEVQPDVYVQLQVMDNNTDVLQRKAGVLLHCPLEFQENPPLAINVRLLGIVPFNGERTWLPNSSKIVSDELQSIKNDKHKELIAQIDFSLSHTIYIKGFFIKHNLVTAQTKTFINLQNFILSKELAQKDKNTMKKLRNMFNDLTRNVNGINLYSNEADSVNESFETAMSMSLSQNDLSDVYEDANTSINSKVSLESSSLELNDFNENTINPNPLDNLNSESINQQTESWCPLPINEVAKIQLANEQDDDYCKDFFVIHQNNEFEKIVDLIEQCMTDKQLSPLTTIKECDSGHNFIIKHDNNMFVRAKLMTIFKSKINDVYQFLLVDLGKYIFLPDSAIKRDDIIYESSNERVFTTIPYQAIYCKLAGIVIHANEKCAKIEGKHISVVAKREYKSSPLQHMGIEGYEIILYECDYDDVIYGGRMLNQHLIDLDAAHYDEETKTDLDVDLSKNMDPKKSVKLLEQCLHNMMAFDQDHTKNFIEQLIGLNDEIDELKPIKTNDKPIKTNDKPLKTTDKPLNTTAKPLKTKNHKEKKCREIKADNNKTTCSRKRKPMLPNTVYPTICPQVIWYQNGAFINMRIEISETADYVVECNGSELLYATKLSDDDPIQYLFHIRLCGYVTQMSHEKHGLHVVVKMLKEMCGMWPSLLELDEKEPFVDLPYIKYNFDHVRIDSEELSHVQRTQLALSRIEAGLYKNTSLDNDDMQDNDDHDEPCNDFNNEFDIINNNIEN